MCQGRTEGDEGVGSIKKPVSPTDPRAAYYLHEVEADINALRQTLANASRDIQDVEQAHIECAMQHLQHVQFWAEKAIAR